MLISSKLFKSVLTIHICADALYSSEHPPAPFPRQIFVELMEMATSSVEFSCNDIMFRQIDRVAMGSPLGPALANIFVGYYESKLFQTTSKPEMYYRYMDDCSAVLLFFLFIYLLCVSFKPGFIAFVNLHLEATTRSSSKVFNPLNRCEC